MMKVLHTADWHLGRMLYGRKRYEEFEAFLGWLCGVVEERGVEVLLMAGDVFDTSTPSNRAQRLYYDFLRNVAKLGVCRHVVLIGGNHDSATFLDAACGMLGLLNIHVVGGVREDVGDEVVELCGVDGELELLVCAVPYLRDRDVRLVEAGEGLDEKNEKLVEGIRGHYAAVAAVAEERCGVWGRVVPIVGMGHLFAAGGVTVEGDGVRELYVGNLARVGRETFPEVMCYVALGHLHVPQVVGGAEWVRYSGSPIAMGFGEAGQEKEVVLVEISGGEGVSHGVRILRIGVPCFQRLERVSGDLEEIERRLGELVKMGESVWVEVDYRGEDVVANLQDLLLGVVEGSGVEILRTKYAALMERVGLRSVEVEESLDELSEEDVFERCLEEKKVGLEAREELRLSYREILRMVREKDVWGE